jgi:hypothetical protein
MEIKSINGIELKIWMKPCFSFIYKQLNINLNKIKKNPNFSRAFYSHSKIENRKREINQISFKILTER